jgi:tRNA A37 methylthiotransferase MiaB
MAIFTTTDRDNVKAALITAATEGVASVSVAGQSVQAYNLDQLRKLLEYILADLATENTHGGMRLRQMVPGETG